MPCIRYYSPNGIHWVLLIWPCLSGPIHLAHLLVSVWLYSSDSIHLAVLILFTSTSSSPHLSLRSSPLSVAKRITSVAFECVCLFDWVIDWVIEWVIGWVIEWVMRDKWRSDEFNWTPAFWAGKLNSLLVRLHTVELESLTAVPLWVQIDGSFYSINQLHSSAWDTHAVRISLHCFVWDQKQSSSPLPRACVAIAIIISPL